MPHNFGFTTEIHYFFQYRGGESLTFSGERHEIALRIPGPGADAIADVLANGLADAEFAIPGQIVADIALDGEPVRHPDGAITLQIEALTVEE